MHALEWIEQHGKFLRSINAAKLRKALGREKRTCTWCGEPVSGGRISWCSQTCVDAFNVRCSPVSIRYYLERTRTLVCARCGLDVMWLKRLEKRLRRIRGCYWDGDLCCNHFKADRHNTNRRGRKNQRRRDRYRKLWRSWKNPITAWAQARSLLDSRGHVWEADHIVPVVEGGGLCGPENYQILCLRCHKHETAALAARRARVPDHDSLQLDLF